VFHRLTARHALTVLADEGLIEVTPGWGSFVKGTTGPQA
jgi:DNA-binding GntR family transcriptional regulator